MSKKFVPKRKFTVKDSSGGQSKELLKTLQKVLLTKEGSVSFIFLSNRIKNIHKSVKKMEDYQIKSIQHLNLTNQMLEGKTPNELIYNLECIRWDLGADYFEVR